MTGAHRHWLDELATRRTRGGFLRAGIAVAAGLVPLGGARPATAATNDPTACRKGCLFTAEKTATRRIDGCESTFHQNSAASAAVTMWINMMYGAAAFGYSFGKAAGCYERVLLTQKASMWDCLQPNCPGFDPAQPGGPCDGCAAYGHCCPDQAVVSGYSCCGGCCNPSGDGCGSGTTQCGG